MTTKKPSKSRGKVRVTDQKSRPQSPLVISPEKGEQEIVKLRRERELLESEPPAGDSDARATLI